MQERDEYRSTKITRGHLVDRIKNSTQEDWVKVLTKLGVTVSKEYGKGSHVIGLKDNCPPEDSTCTIVTLAKNQHSEIQRDLFKKVLTHGLKTGLYKEDDIWKAFGIKVR